MTDFWRMLGDGTLYLGAIAGAVVTIVGAIYALKRANANLIRAEVRDPMQRLATDLTGKIDGITASLNGRLDQRIDWRIEKQVRPVAEQLEHIDAELSRHLPGYRQGPR